MSAGPDEARRLRIYAVPRSRDSGRATREWKEIRDWAARKLVTIRPRERGWATVELTTAGRVAAGVAA